MPAPSIAQVNGRHQALAWNMGTTGSTVSDSRSPNVIAITNDCMHRLCASRTTPFGLPVVPDV